MMNASQYEDSLRKLKLNVYLFGKQIADPVDDPIIRPSLNAVAATYAFAHLPEYESIMTATSHLSGKKINRFTHIHQSVDDLVNKSRMGRLLGSMTGCCFQRCVGMDALNALSITTWAIDQKYGQQKSRTTSNLKAARLSETTPRTFGPVAFRPHLSVGLAFS